MTREQFSDALLVGGALALAFWVYDLGGACCLLGGGIALVFGFILGEDLIGNNSGKTFFPLDTDGPSDRIGVDQSNQPTGSDDDDEEGSDPEGE
jgi:hypothetical protein